MNRIIKFRAWVDRYEYMIYSGQHKELEGLTFNNDGAITIHEGDGDQEYNSENTHLMQFTGLFDKNGKEIYEGDIVKVFNKGYMVNDNCIVNWGKKSHGWSLKCAIDDKWIKVKYYGLGNSKDIEIIGNIHQNKELLNAPN